MAKRPAKELTPEILRELEELVEAEEQRRERAAERLADQPDGQWYFGLVGFRATAEPLDLGQFGEVRSVVEPPSVSDLVCVLRDPGMFAAVGRYCPLISHEYAIPKDIGLTASQLLNGGRWILSSLRVKALADFLVPVVADHTWSGIAGLPERTCEVQFLEDVPSSVALDRQVVVTQSDCDWVRENALSIFRLALQPRFRLAWQAMTTDQQSHSLRMMIASVWSGIEALLDVRAELRFRIALYAACLLEPRGAARIAMYKRIKKLYDVRSRVVRGTPMKHEELSSHLLETRRVLSRLLCVWIETGEAPTEADLERRLLGD